MSKRVLRTDVFGADGVRYEAGTPESKVPEAAKIAEDNHLAWVDESEAAAESPAGAPPKAGPGSGKQAWSEFAARHGVEVDPEDNREDIIDALEAAGIPTD